MAKILIVGKVPPPVGGVTRHVQRLLWGLRAEGFEFNFCDLQNDGWFDILFKLMTHRTIHIHISNPNLQVLFAVFCQLTFKRLIITYHGKWGRYQFWGNLAVRISAYLAHTPVVQESASLAHAHTCNRRARQISTYIADPDIQPLPSSVYAELCARRSCFEATFCTNAWNVAYDKNRREIYGILEIIERFAAYPEYQLIISDPSGNYYTLSESRLSNIPNNILFFNQIHDFRSILLQADAFIRNTTTDGVSLSIHEAHALGISVLASSNVDRPAFCAVFDHFSKTDLKEKLREAKLLAAHREAASDPVAELIALYRKVEGKKTQSTHNQYKKTKA